VTQTAPGAPGGLAEAGRGGATAADDAHTPTADSGGGSADTARAGLVYRLAGFRPARPADLMARVACWSAALPPRRRAVAQDSALALGLAALNLLSLLPYHSQLHPLWLALLLVSGQCLPLALRRVLPVPTIIASGLIRNLYDALMFGYAPLPLAPAIAVATVAERSGRVLRLCTAVGVCSGLAWSQTLPGHNQPYDAIVQVFIFGAAWAVGTLSRYRRAALAVAASRAARAEAALDEAAASAAAAERLRIARELHDVVAHHVSLMAVQAEAVGALLPGRPEAAAASADLIGSTARAAMTELRRLLGVLRFKDGTDSERARLTPVPSMSRLDELVDAAREAGLTVTSEISGPASALPPGIDLTAYRIVQEALTNAVRHAPGSAAAVRVSYAQAHLSVAVSNGAAATGTVPVVRSAVAPSPVTPYDGPGYGLAGIAERVASCGGSLTLGPAGDGGFAVTARLPLT
jgi:signal transduction histidine kinase